jgi:hypothetical protein
MRVRRFHKEIREVGEASLIHKEIREIRGALFSWIHSEIKEIRETLSPGEAEPPSA